MAAGLPAGDSLLPIAPDFTTWLAYFVASGCYTYGSGDREPFRRWWKIVTPVVPFAVAPKDNLWLRHHSRFYEGEALEP